MSIEGVADDEHEYVWLSFKALGAGLWDYDIDRDRLICSARWYQILGVDPTERVISTIEEFKPCIHPEDVEAATQIDLERISQILDRDEHYHNEFRIVRPTGEIRWVRSIACVIVDKISGSRRAIGSIVDITDARAGEGAPAAGPAPAPGDGPREDAGLTARELECLEWVSLGKTAWETGKILDTSARTVEYHLRNAIEKLDATNKIHAAAIAIRLRLF